MRDGGEGYEFLAGVVVPRLVNVVTEIHRHKRSDRAFPQETAAMTLLRNYTPPHAPLDHLTQLRLQHPVLR
jgi:hypothetical protein